MSQEVTIHGKTYPSMAAAARDLGVHYSTIFEANRNNRLDTVGSQPDLEKRAKKPVTILGRQFESVTEAAEWLGVPTPVLSNYRKVAAILETRNSEK